MREGGEGPGSLAIKVGIRYSPVSKIRRDAQRTFIGMIIIWIRTCTVQCMRTTKIRL